MITPNPAAASGGASSQMGGETCLPGELLAVDGVSPAEGDDVEFSVKGTVTRTEGGNVYVQPTAINGLPIPAGAAPAAEPSEDDMRSMAEEADGY